MDKNKTNTALNSNDDIIDAIKTIKQAILHSRYQAAALVNRELLSLYYGIGGYISSNSRQGFWGTGALENISKSLQQELPGLRGFSVGNIRKMRIFYEEWNKEFSNRALATHDLKQIEFRALITHELEEAYFGFLNIGFTHHYEILKHTHSIEERKYYIQKCATEFWTVEKLRYNLKSNLYSSEGAMFSNFNSTIKNIDFGKAAIKSFKDEYLLDFVNIEDVDEIDERVLEHEIVLNIKKFIMALGSDFSFLGNQYRLIVDEKEYFLDLLFFNRRLQSLVVIELKRGEFKPEYAGKMNFYLSALDEDVKMPHENPSIGIILCKSQSQKIVEFAFKDTSKPMGVAVYKLASELPEKYKDILPNPDMLRELL